MYWRRITSKGALWGGSIGLLTAVTCMVTGPTIWVDILGNPEILFPYKHPALFSMTGAFVSIYVISIFDTSELGAQEIAQYEMQLVESQVGPLDKCSTKS
jgi:cation/acetate symporter